MQGYSVANAFGQAPPLPCDLTVGSITAPVIKTRLIKDLAGDTVFIIDAPITTIEQNLSMNGKDLSAVNQIVFSNANNFIVDGTSLDLNTDNLILTGDQDISGTLFVSGATEINNQLTVDGALDCGSTVTVNDSALFNGTLEVKDVATFDSSVIFKSLSPDYSNVNILGVDASTGTAVSSSTTISGIATYSNGPFSCPPINYEVTQIGNTFTFRINGFLGPCTSTSPFETLTFGVPFAVPSEGVRFTCVGVCVSITEALFTGFINGTSIVINHSSSIPAWQWQNGDPQDQGWYTINLSWVI